LPKGIWRKVGLVDGDDSDINQPELRVRGGAIIPLGPVVQSTAGYKPDPITLLVCPDENGEAHGLLYEDAGDGFGYRDDEFRLMEYGIRKIPRLGSGQAEDGISLESRKIDGDWPMADRGLVVKVVTENGILQASGKEGDRIEVRMLNAEGTTARPLLIEP